ncbi:MAG: hypothetical protein PHW19_09510 [Salinivirgaceae bacterium]|nr:hypothetical protein [Salinivirgaceae bacterium]
MADIDSIIRLTKLIAHEKTGSRNSLAQQFQVTPQTITNWVNTIETLYFVEICYCRTAETYKVVKGELPPYLK